MNRELLFKYMKDFLRKIEWWRKQIKEVNWANAYSLWNTLLENEEPEYIELDIKQTKYAVIINFQNVPINEKIIQDNLKFLEIELKTKAEEIFWKKIKTIVFYRKKIMIIFWDVLYYKDIQKYNEELPYEYIFYWIDLLTNDLIYVKDTTALHHNILWATNTGKTVALINIMASLSNRKVYDEYPNLRPDFLILEKANDFNILFPFANMLYKWNITSISNAEIILVFFYLRLIYQERNKIMKERWNYQNIHEYNENVPIEERMNLKFIFIDEFKTLIDRFTWKSKKEFEIKVWTITQLYRSAGIYLYIWTQNFGWDKWVPTSIRWNIRTYLIWHTEDVSQYYRFLKPDSYLTASKIKLWDFLFKNPDSWTENIIRIPYIYSDLEKTDDDLLQKFNDLQETLNLPVKEELEWNDELLEIYLSNSEYYWKKILTKYVEDKLDDFGNIKILNKNFLAEAWVDLEDLDIIWLKKIWLIILSNLFNEYIEQVQQSINNKLDPEQFNIENLLDNVSEKYPIIWFLTMYVRELYNTYCKWLVDNNINKKINKLWWEWNETYQVIEDSLMWIIRITAEKLAQIKDDIE